MKKTLFVILMALSLNVKATNLIFGGIGIHLSGKDFNNWHKMIALEYNDFAAGYFVNSYYKDSFFIGYRHKNYQNSVFSYYTGYGVVTNYGDKCFLYRGTDLCPYISGHIKIENVPLSPTINIFGESLSLTLEVPINWR